MRIRRNIPTILQNGGVGVLPTDTIYGVVGSALNRRTVERIYKLRRRNPRKPMIILIGSLGDLRRFGVRPSSSMARRLRQFWFDKKTGPVSVVLATSNMRPRAALLRGRQATWRRKWQYLHRGTNTLAFRLPQPVWLRRLLKKTGPLVAPSANWEGKPPARTVREAKKYFRNEVDFYVDDGRIEAPPSMLVKIENGRVSVLRMGTGKI